MHKLNEHIHSVVPIKTTGLLSMLFIILFCHGCLNDHNDKLASPSLKVHLMILAPGHFHGALLQKFMYEQIDSTVHVFAPNGPEVESYLALIHEYNSRAGNPTGWKENVYMGSDYLEKMLKAAPGNVVVIAGNNERKTEYIKKSVDAGLNVLADKPMAITKLGFDKLIDAVADAKKNKVLLYDIMTERYEITNILQKAFAHLPDVFGELQNGTLENPAIYYESMHYFYKKVSGNPLVRPAWYFDVDQQGEGIVDVATHLVDLIQWECFPGLLLNYQNDIHMFSAKHWPTALTLSQFNMVTQNDSFPDFLKKDVKDNLLNVYANGEMNYTIKGIHAKVSVVWKFEALEGTGDTYYSMLRGTKANLVIKQSKEQQYKPVLYIEPLAIDDQKSWEINLESRFGSIRKEYPGIGLKKSKEGWEVRIPEHYKTGHEQHFAQVVKRYLKYLQEGNMPDWEIPNMLAKYYTTTLALGKAVSKQRYKKNRRQVN